ncbi:hypothetical protein BS17DRAFT_763845 [Gyrodon lividus]|nr:hypothetical protein BS17DRAFT_763845 [Gyrodon lividus]
MFWSTVSYEFFEKWHEINEGFPGVMHQCLTTNQQQALGKFVEACKGQIRSWFYHMQSEESKARATDFSKCITKIMGSTIQGTHRPSAVEMFMQTEEFAKVREASEEASESSNENTSTRKLQKTGLGITAMKRLAEVELSSQSKEFQSEIINHAKEECKCCTEVAQAGLEALHNPDIAQHINFQLIAHGPISASAFVWLGGKLELGSHFQPMGPLEEYHRQLDILPMGQWAVLVAKLQPFLQYTWGWCVSANIDVGMLWELRKPITQTLQSGQPLSGPKHMSNLLAPTQCAGTEKALEMMKQAQESWQKITEQITCLTKQSERQQKQMAHLSLLEASLDLLQEGNTILHGHLQRQEELMAAQEWDLVAKIVDKRGGATPLTFGQASTLLS